jgi:hypothetical protein
MFDTSILIDNITVIAHIPWQKNLNSWEKWGRLVQPTGGYIFLDFGIHLDKQLL